MRARTASHRFTAITSRSCRRGSPNGFALVAWPATYDVTGVMTFVVNQDGIVRQKDLGPDTGRAAGAMAAYNRDTTWDAAQ